MDQFLNILQNFGIAVTVMFAMGVAIWRVTTWLASNVFQPAIAKHMKLVDDLSAAMLAQTSAMNAISDKQSDMLEAQKALSEEHKEIARMLQDRGRKGGG